MTGPVVVGLDGSAASVTAAWWAAREAMARHVPVLLLRSWTTQPLDVPYETDEYGRLEAALAPWRQKFPAVDVVDHVARGPAAQVLLAASTHSMLTVLGRRRHPSPLSWRLGPVTHAALHHGPCPVAVVPHD
ncbi:universal stress protein [Streptomyces sp. NPDC057257]|uniref:universal stress protein n=1 Tax=Streptomyces sp. NPDC057257 TaxID=3346071 RepID=UPI00363E3CA9